MIPVKPTLAVVFLLIAGLTVSTAAVTLEGDSTGEIILEPASSPNGNYAAVEDGQLELSLEKLNDRAITRANNVFTITVTNESVDRVWIEHNVTGLTFYHGNDLTNTISKSNPIEVSSGDTEHIGVAIDTHVAQEGTETFTVTAQYADNETEPDQSTGGSGGASDSSSSPSPAIEHSTVTVSPTTVSAGDTVTVTATYRNVGDALGQTTAQVTVDGIVVDQRTIVLEPGEERTVTFERTMDWPGTHEVGVSGAGSQSVTVGGPPIDVVTASVDRTTVTTGDATTVRATVTNPTDRGVDRTLEVAVDGIVVDSRAVSIPAHSERTVTFERELETPGTYEIAVSGVPAGEVTVEEPGGFSLQNRDLSPATTAALAPPATAGLLFLAVAANRRWSIFG
ncbi:CARDB protein [Natrinema hispanicum]|uniref:CARDB protein n=1 Tax=Natrinema hispanicum TaxID=392421 RepID=A0A482YFK6_9EURY|nr:CARDB domain-containing protein [Natrinema hispanicum]RZV11709.1 CARDB protein [Natrinema hispanicum]